METKEKKQRLKYDVRPSHWKIGLHSCEHALLTFYFVLFCFCFSFSLHLMLCAWEYVCLLCIHSLRINSLIFIFIYFPHIFLSPSIRSRIPSASKQMYLVPFHHFTLDFLTLITFDMNLFEAYQFKQYLKLCVWLFSLSSL